MYFNIGLHPREIILTHLRNINLVQILSNAIPEETISAGLPSVNSILFFVDFARGIVILFFVDAALRRGWRLVEGDLRMLLLRAMAG